MRTISEKWDLRLQVDPPLHARVRRTLVSKGKLPQIITNIIIITSIIIIIIIDINYYY